MKKPVFVKDIDDNEYRLCKTRMGESVFPTYWLSRKAARHMYVLRAPLGWVTVHYFCRNYAATRFTYHISPSRLRIGCRIFKGVDAAKIKRWALDKRRMQ
jgi:hypothetical protein